MLIYNTYMYKSAAGGEQIYNQSYAGNAVIDLEQQANDTPEALSSLEFSEDRNSRKLQRSNSSDASIFGAAKVP